jgi:hypothetical protein
LGNDVVVLISRRAFTPITGIVAAGATCRIFRAGMTTGTGQTWIDHCHIVMSNAIRLTCSMALLACGQCRHIYTNCIVTAATFEPAGIGNIVVALGRLPLVAGVAICRAGRVTMAAFACGVVGCSIVVVSDLGIPGGSPKGGIMTVFTIVNRLNVCVAGLTTDAVAIGSNMVLVTDTASVTVKATICRTHGAVTTGTVDWIGRISRSGIMVRGLNAPLVAIQTISQITDVAVTLSAITTGRRRGTVVRVCPRHKTVALSTVTTGRYSGMTLFTKALLICSAGMVVCCGISTMALRTLNSQCQIRQQ